MGLVQSVGYQQALEHGLIDPLVWLDLIWLGGIIPSIFEDAMACIRTN
ncbi:10671_t:CDS:2 [Ambispora leptoticha]|uniref:10671_t:CDS:1 n=1 Tax=Ambispora leptoticha TaxID=144679 RepID=A0A9N9FEP3_9GLOM|nr:10671_t:CDS:2 [Ambispora leptoticha]